MKRVFKIIGGMMCIIGGLWFLLPVLHGGFRLGAAFGLCVCAAGLILVLKYKKLVAKGGVLRVCIRIITALYGAGLCWAVFLTVMMFTAQYRPAPENTNVIVLGAQVYSSERMGVSLTGRVDKAYEYLKDNPEAICIVTGGQGDDEPCPEALTQKNVLSSRGIDRSRIFMEDKSRNTRQNMELAMDIARAESLGTEFVVVTQSFHMYRALMLAESVGFTAYSLVADTDPILFPEYYGRELLSLTKWFVERLILE